MLAIAGISQDPAQEQSLPDIKPPVMEVSAYNRDLDVTYNSIPLLAKKSWRNWSFFMTHYLKKRKLFFLIENDAKDRIEAESMYGSLNDNVLRRLRKETVSAIANKLPPDTQGEIGQIKDPKRLWDMAITKCLEEPARLSVEPLLAFLDWRWDYSAVDPMDNLAGIKRIHEDLKATYGSEIEVKFMIIQRLLTFLPTDFTRARDSCSGKRDVEFDEVEEAMRRAIAPAKIGSNESISSTKHASTSRTSAEGSPKCTHCHKFGHKIEKCYHLKQRSATESGESSHPPNGLFPANLGGNESISSNRQASTSKTSGEGSPKCTHCHKFGHKVERCFHLKQRSATESRESAHPPNGPPGRQGGNWKNKNIQDGKNVESGRQDQDHRYSKINGYRHQDGRGGSDWRPHRMERSASIGC